MRIAYVSIGRRLTALAAGALLLSSLALGGCATSNPGSSPMDARAEAPAPHKTSAYPALGSAASEREDHAMTPDERSKLKQELLAARDRQAVAAKSQGGPLEPLKP
jgi:hypothetical protein